MFDWFKNQEYSNRVTSMIVLLWCIGIATFAIVTGRELKISDAALPFVTYIVKHFGDLGYMIQNNSASIKAAGSNIQPEAVALAKQALLTSVPQGNNTTNGHNGNAS